MHCWKLTKCLYDDSQLFIFKSGRIVHFDIDRCFWFGDDGTANEKKIDPQTIAVRHAMIKHFVCIGEGTHSKSKMRTCMCARTPLPVSDKTIAIRHLPCKLHKLEMASHFKLRPLGLVPTDKQRDWDGPDGCFVVKGDPSRIFDTQTG